MKTEDQNALAALEKRLTLKFDEIAEAISKDLGYGPLASLSAEKRERVVADAEEATENWDEAEVASASPLTAGTPLQKLLKEYNGIADTILDIRDADLEK